MYIASNVGTDIESAIADFRARCKAMREEGATSWADIVLGPLPSAPGGKDDDETQRSDRLELLSKERDRRIRFGASGGPRRIGNDR
jgi:hypothetical protein